MRLLIVPNIWVWIDQSEGWFRVDHIRWPIPVLVVSWLVDSRSVLCMSFCGNGCYLFLQVNDSDLVVMSPGYGKAVPKMCHLSPDGWFQMALQLTFYRMHKKFVLTYESATTRSVQSQETYYIL